MEELENKKQIVETGMKSFIKIGLVTAEILLTLSLCGGGGGGGGVVCKVIFM